jgi:ribonuclease R
LKFKQQQKISSSVEAAALSPDATMIGSVLGHRDGHGFVQRDDGEPDVYLPPNEMRAVLHHDRVSVRVVRWDRKGRPEAKVVDIIERPKQPIIGRLLQESGQWLLAPEDKRFGRDVLIPKGQTGGAEVGKVVVVELTDAPALFVQPVGKVIEVLGDADDPGMEIEIAVRKYGVPHSFSEAALAAAKALPNELQAADYAKRVDLTDVALVTIDGEDARDFDDAVYCQPHVLDSPVATHKNRSKKTAAAADASASAHASTKARANATSSTQATETSSHGWRLLVAIADVSHYVRPGSALDADAYERATSVYFPRRVLPMLPEKISNGLCSLKPDVDRLCMVCDMVIDAAGDVTAYQFYPAVMHSHARLTYTEVAAILSNTKGPQAAKRKALIPHLLHLHDAYRALLSARQRRGAVDFETTETQIVCNEAGRVEAIVPRTRNEAHRLIEEAMLAANVCTADFVGRAKLAEQPALYRVHEGPTPQKREILNNFLHASGLQLRVSETPTPKEFQAIATATHERPDAKQIHTMLLRSMQQAIYSPYNSGHFGLAYGAYTHFTSPIRRYPDLLVHRVIKARLTEQVYHLANLPAATEQQLKLSRLLSRKKNEAATFVGKQASGRPGGKLDTGSSKPLAPKTPKLSAKAQAQVELWASTGLHCSANERRADEASRDVEAWLKCQYMREHLGEEFVGAVSAVTSFGLFVLLDTMYVEGLVHITELGGDYYRFDEARQELRGERTGMRYALGSKLRVQVSRVDLDARKIDFRLMRESDAVPVPKVQGGKLELSLAQNKPDAVELAEWEQRTVLKKLSRKAQTQTSSRATRGGKSIKSVPMSPLAELPVVGLVGAQKTRKAALKKPSLAVKGKDAKTKANAKAIKRKA